MNQDVDIELEVDKNVCKGVAEEIAEVSFSETVYEGTVDAVVESNGNEEDENDDDDDEGEQDTFIQDLVHRCNNTFIDENQVVPCEGYTNGNSQLCFHCSLDHRWW